MAVNNRFIIDEDGDVLDNCSNKKNCFFRRHYFCFKSSRFKNCKSAI